MTSEGVFPKVAGDVVYASEYNDEISRVTYLESINQNTILSQNASVTDKTYTYADTDTFSDSGGYNNTVDTANSTSQYDGYDKSYLAGTNEVGSSSNLINNTNTFGNAAGTATTVYSSVVDLGAIYYITAVTYNWTATGGRTNNTTRLQGSTDQISWTDIATAGTWNYNSGSGIESGTNMNAYYRYLRIKGTRGTGTGVDSSSSTDTTTTITVKPLQTSIVQTNSKTFDSNVKSIIINANKITSGASTITTDISSSAGSAWDVTAQPLDTMIALSGNNTDIITKFNLNVDASGNTPELYGYSYQVFV